MGTARARRPTSACRARRGRAAATVLGDLDAVDVLDQDRELVAAQARDHVAARAARATMRRPASTSISSPAAWPTLSLTSLKRSRSRNSTANGVRAGFAHARDRGVQAVEQVDAVGQAGQRVVQGLVGQALLGAQALADLRAQLAVGPRPVRACAPRRATSSSACAAFRRSCARLRARPLSMWWATKVSSSWSRCGEADRPAYSSAPRSRRPPPRRGTAARRASSAPCGPKLRTVPLRLERRRCRCGRPAAARPVRDHVLGQALGQLARFAHGGRARRSSTGTRARSPSSDSSAM